MSLVGHIYYADDNNGRYWDLDTMLRHDPNGTTHPQSEWTTDEVTRANSWLQQIHRQQLYANVVAQIQMIKNLASTAQDDITTASNNTTLAQTFTTNTTNRAATIRATTPAANLAFVTALRDEAANAADRDVTVGNAIVDLLQWRQEADSFLEVLCTAVAWLGKIVSNSTLDPP